MTTNNQTTSTANIDPLSDQIRVILGSLVQTKDIAYFASNVLKLSDDRGDKASKFFNDPRLKDGFGELSGNLLYYLDHLVERLKELDLPDYEKADGVFLMSLAYRQTSLLYELSTQESKRQGCGLRLKDFSSYHLIFDDMHTNMAALHAHFSTYLGTPAINLPDGALSKSDFEKIGTIACQRFDTVLNHWLPAGRYEGDTYLARNLKEPAGKHWSISINTDTGQWCDHAAGERGVNLISLIAHLDGLTIGKAAKALALYLSIDLNNAGVAA